jgi:predicted dinucleotide-utilizing enzyme
LTSIRPLGVGLLGLGTVGTGVARVLLAKGDALERRIGRPVRIISVLVRDPNKPRSVSVPAPLVTDPQAVIDDPEVDIVVEVLGGEEPARTLILQAIERGKHVVTANKEVMAKHGPRILAAAALKGVSVPARSGRQRHQQRGRDRERHHQLHPDPHDRERRELRRCPQRSAGAGLRRTGSNQ